MQLLIIILVFFTAFCLLAGLLRALTAERRALDTRVDVFTSSLLHGERPGGGKAKRPARSLKSLYQQASKLFVGSLSKKIEIELSKADIPLKGEEFIFANFLAIILPGLFGFFVLENFGSGIVLGILGFLIPRLWVKQTKRKRIAKFNSQIGDSLTIMSNSLRAGFSFLQTMEMISREIAPPIGEEFGRCLREMNLGTPTEQALVNLGHRIESDDLDLVITAVLIQRQVGGNLAEVLDNISQTIRARIRIKSEIKTLTAQGRMSGLIIGALPVLLGIVLYLMNPAYIGNLFTTGIGLSLVAGGVVSQAIGIAVIRKIVNIEV